MTASVDVFVRVRQLAARVGRGTEEVLGLLEEGESLRVLVAAVAAVRAGRSPDPVGLEAAFTRYDQLRSRVRRVGGPPASSSLRSPRSRNTRRQVPRSGRS